jgi:hypothetical protein
MQRWRPAYSRLNMRHPLANGLVFAGLGGGASTNAYLDSSPYGNHGVLTWMDAATDWVWSSTLNRFVLDFDGTNDYVAWSGGTAISGNVSSLSCWIMCRTYDTAGFVFFGTNTGGNCYWQWQNTGVVFIQGVATTNSSGAINDSVFRHICCTSSGSLLAVHVNGVQGMTRAIAPTALAAGVKSFGIGDWVGSLGGNFSLNGQMTDVLFHNRVLSPSEISALADPSNVMLSGLILPPRRRLWAVSGGGTPAAFKAAWARNSNNLIGGGVG